MVAEKKGWFWLGRAESVTLSSVYWVGKWNFPNSVLNYAGFTLTCWNSLNKFCGGQICTLLMIHPTSHPTPPHPCYESMFNPVLSVMAFRTACCLFLHAVHILGDFKPVGKLPCRLFFFLKKENNNYSLELLHSYWKLNSIFKTLLSCCKAQCPIEYCITLLVFAFKTYSIPIILLLLNSLKLICLFTKMEFLNDESLHLPSEISQIFS